MLGQRFTFAEYTQGLLIQLQCVQPPLDGSVDSEKTTALAFMPNDLHFKNYTEHKHQLQSVKIRPDRIKVKSGQTMLVFHMTYKLRLFSELHFQH